MGDWKHKQKSHFSPVWDTHGQKASDEYGGFIETEVSVRALFLKKDIYSTITKKFPYKNKGTGMDPNMDWNEAHEKAHKFMADSLSLTDWLDFECLDGWEVLKIWKTEGGHSAIFRRRANN